METLIPLIQRKVSAGRWCNKKWGYFDVLDVNDEISLRFVETAPNNEYRIRRDNECAIIAKGFIVYLINNLNSSKIESEIDYYDNYYRHLIEEFKNIESKKAGSSKRNLDSEFYEKHIVEEKERVEQSQQLLEFLTEKDKEDINNYVSCYFEYIKEFRPLNDTEEIQNQSGFFDKDPRQGGKQIPFWKFIEQLENAGAFDNLKKKGLVFNPTHDFEKLKEVRQGLFEKRKQKFINDRNFNEVKTTDVDLLYFRGAWLANELKVVAQWLSDTHPNGEKKKLKSSISTQIELGKYELFIREEIENTRTAIENVSINTHFDMENKNKDVNKATSVGEITENQSNCSLNNIFAFIDFLKGKELQFIEQEPIINELQQLERERKELDKNKFSGKIKYDAIQKIMEEKWNVIKPLNEEIKNKLIELGILSDGDVLGTSIHNRNIGIVHDVKTNATIPQALVIKNYLEIYIGVRKNVNIKLRGLGFYFSNLDEVLHPIYQYFNESDVDEFDAFTTKPIKLDEITPLLKNSDSATESTDNGKKIPAKYYALYHWVLIEMGKEKAFERNMNGQYVKSEIENYARNRYPGISSQQFYNEFRGIDITNRKAIARSFDTDYKDKLIKISNNNADIIAHLRNYPN